MHANDVTLFEIRAAEDGGCECAPRDERVEVVVSHFLEIAPASCEVGWVRIIDAILIPRPVVRPCADVVAHLDFKSSFAVSSAVFGAKSGDTDLGLLLALVDPYCAAEDGQIFGL